MIYAPNSIFFNLFTAFHIPHFDKKLQNIRNFLAILTELKLLRNTGNFEIPSILILSKYYKILKKFRDISKLLHNWK